MTRWIGGPVFDACFFFGSGVVALMAGLLMLAAPGTVLPMWFAWIWLVEGPHLLATWQRTYLDAGFRRERGRLLWTSLAWLLPGPVLLAASWISGRPEPFLLFLGAVALWSFHHAVRQHHGILSVYQRLGDADAVARKADKLLLHGILWVAFGLLALAHPANVDLAARVSWGAYAIAALAALLVAAMVLWAVLLVRRWRGGSAVLPGIFGLVVAVGTTLFSLFAVGMREPLLANPLTTEQVFMAATIVGGTLHGLQYIGIVIATERRRARSGMAARRVYALMLAASLLYVALNVARGGAPVGAAPGSASAQVFLALYWGLFCHHFWLDQKIWRPSSDARLRAELGLETA
ncbi:hypothetical protein [Massilia antarctica]|uniref:hypothetical protein n=1 Tax=Massilia antarctica TaxID=2765360 RepID=UPI0006BB641D|nr:hypothetical protein [Massilia sp. H27-R4]MCY0910794.1 hypothetical protein [Massilia sp. H27-R4]CUI08824.1 hypothetical protein BN2497_12425 [Janthinobacterium sp. CG23_2]CUU32610.1 hypothetical protein BN3177_12425 [Janthinobacterium sp. CG23_2]